MTISRALGFTVLLTMLGCAAEEKATATLASKSGSTTTGTATFTDSGDKVKLKLEVAGGVAGKHAVHIHEVGDCSAADATSAGGHWNPTTQSHGAFDGGSGHHMGDIGNIDVGADGKGTLEMETSLWSVAGTADAGTADAGTTNNNVVGHSLIVHANVDDFTTQPTGNAGGRVACGVITAQP
jgi:superoxide dismutase, Cu-Zn family